jgi:L-fuculose-phosphate aldolase
MSARDRRQRGVPYLFRGALVREEKYDVWTHARKMWEAGLVAASSGNVSRRCGDRIAITPTSIPYSEMTPNQIAIVDLATGESRDTPSYETPMHLVIYRERPDIDAIVHTHAPFISTLSVLRKPLPPVLDEMNVQFGGTIEVAEYAITGSEALGHNAVRAMGERPGVILASHGNVCVAGELSRALHIAIAMEACARIYVQALQIGTPSLL